MKGEEPKGINITITGEFLFPLLLLMVGIGVIALFTRQPRPSSIAGIQENAQVTTVPTATPSPPPKSDTSSRSTRITHDGTRTGRIVDYFSYCDKKTIKVYENELIPYTTKVGKQIYSTKDDIACYEREYGKQVDSLSNATNQIPSIGGSSRIPTYVGNGLTGGCVNGSQQAIGDAVRAVEKATTDWNACMNRAYSNDLTCSTNAGCVSKTTADEITQCYTMCHTVRDADLRTCDLLRKPYDDNLTQLINEYCI